MVAGEILQDLFVQDRVHTLSRSRAAILFKDETQVRLNANAELAVRSLSDRKGSSSVMELLQGEGWFRTKNPSSDLHVATPGATAAIRGTEINLRVVGPEETILTVVEGNVEFSNDQGSITVNTGEEAIARKGQAPIKRLILSPEDAVQWVIYYPLAVSWHDFLDNSMSDAVRGGFLSLKAGDAQRALAAFLPSLNTDGWARVGASMAYMSMADSGNAVAVLGGPLSGLLEAERLCQLGVVSLSAGDALSARTSFDSARARAPDSLRAAVLSATVELACNNKEKAREISQTAVTAHPESVSANIAAGEVAQAYFNLPRALQYFDAAFKIDPDDIRALVDRARVLFGMGRAEEAGIDAERASRLAPEDPQVKSLHGFILLSRGKPKEASLEFKAAIDADSSFGEPHLGMGLIAFKQGMTDEGLWELLVATLLDPKISLYQSYLGKAYYQLKRFTEGLAALDSGVRLDTRDPTPHLYKSFFLRDLNRDVDALEELNMAIALNDNRAVYRGRLLLDQDLATKNVSLAETYSNIGLDAWGVSHALNSLNSDFTNASAHLFLARLYNNLPDRLQAAESEVLQYILFSPVNQNSFTAFNEYTSLLEQPAFSISAYADGLFPSYGNLSRPSYNASGTISTQSGNDFFSHLSVLQYEYGAGARPSTPDQVGSFDLTTKAALGTSADVFLHTTVNLYDTGDSENTLQLYTSGPYAVNITQMGQPADPNNSDRELYFNVALGGRNDWAPGFPLSAVLQYEYDKLDDLIPYNAYSDSPGVLWNDEVQVSWSVLDFQAQQVLRLGDRFQLMAGSEAFNGSWTYVEAGSKNGNPAITRGWSSDSYENGLHGWVWNKFQLLDSLHISAAGFYQIDKGTNLVVPTLVNQFSQFYPAVGLTLDLGSGAVVRAAAFQFRTARYFPQTIYPSSIAGFLLDRNEDIYTYRSEAHLSLDNLFPVFFLSNHIYYRESTYPPLSLSLLTKAETIGLANDVKMADFEKLLRISK